MMGWIIAVLTAVALCAMFAIVEWRACQHDLDLKRPEWVSCQIQLNECKDILAAQGFELPERDTYGR